MATDTGEPVAWIVAALGLWVLVSPFVFGIAGGYRTSLVVVGVLVAVLAGWRAAQPDERVPLPFLFGDGLDVHGITLVVSGVVFVVVPAMMINRMLDEEAGEAGGTSGV
jgi:hypothetical protein